MQKTVSGIVQNISTNPFQTFSRKKGSSSALLSFDISFDIHNDDGEVVRVWFNRSFRLPPSLDNGDYIEVHGKYGRFFRRVGKNNFYATKIVDKARGMEYSAWRNKKIAGGDS